ncbi:L,D-transpeptidase, partial [Rhizobium johnstonii]
IDLHQRCPIDTAVQVLPHMADQAESAAQVSQITPFE